MWPLFIGERMRKWIGILSILAWNASASDSNVWDVQYLPKAGSLYAQSGLSYSSGEAKKSSTTAIFGWSYSQLFGYAPTDRFLLSTRIRISELTYQYISGSRARFTGWSDPSIDTRYRLFDEKFLVDLLGGGIVATESAYTNFGGTANAHGSNDLDFLGGPQLYLGLEMGQKFPELQYSLLAQGSRIMNSTTRYKGNPTESNDPYNIWTFQGTILNNLSQNKWLLRTTALTKLVDGYLSQAAETKQKYSTAPLIEYRLGTEIDYVLSRDVMAVAGINYRQFKFNSGTIDHYYIWVSNISLKYQF